ncbi:MAG TPA: glycosyltransferase [Pseudolabrys sp.]|nr:glycosyltransferase [Pseudolabrys sp.]
MLSAIIATHESERALVPTLTALVPATAAGLLTEVVIADAGSRDATADVAEFAGCRFISSTDPAGMRLKAAAASTRSPWLLFLRAGAAPEAGWVQAVERFMAANSLSDSDQRAAVFRPAGIGDLMRPGLSELAALVRVTFGGGPRPEQGLLIARRFYDAIGGHSGGEQAEAMLLRRLGRRKVAVLPVAIGLSL